MAWVDDLGRVKINGKSMIGASFGGAPFFVESSDRSGGRRAEVHEFPGADEPYVEDFGRKSRRFSVTGYIVGKSYLDGRDALIDALETEGAQELSHPYHGPRQCICTDFSVTESTAEGGFASFSMTFEETAELPNFRLPSLDPPSLLNLAGDALLLSIQAKMATQYNAGGLIADFLLPIVDLIDGAGQALNSPGSALLQNAQDLAAFRWRVNGLASRVTGVIRDGAALYDEIYGLLDFAFSPPTLPSSFADLLGVIDVDWFRPTPSPVQTESRTRQGELFTLVAWAIRRVVLVRTANLAAESEIPVYLDARSVRDMLLMRVDAEAQYADDEDFFLLQGLRAAIDKAVPRDVEQEKERVVLTLNDTTTSLALAHRYHGNVEQELAIVAANSIERPGFVLGGSTVELTINA